MYEQDFQQVDRRLKFFSVFVFSILVIYLFRLFSMQIVQGAQFRKQSQTISQRSERIPAQRGEIFDRNANIPMVLNTNTFAVSVTPGKIPKKSFSTVIVRLPSRRSKKNCRLSVLRFRVLKYVQTFLMKLLPRWQRISTSFRGFRGIQNRGATMLKRGRFLISSVMSAI